MNGETNTSEENVEQKVAGYCRVCGKALMDGEPRVAGGTIYCEQHLPATPPPPPIEAAPLPGSPYAGPPRTEGDSSPGLAFILGIIPGVGAIYNSQYAKGFIHVVIFGVIISLIASESGGLGLLIPLLVAWLIYMPFEAFHTAKKKQRGEYPDEFSSLVPLKLEANSKVGPIVLIAAGILFLLITLDVFNVATLIKFSPVLLIALGVYMLYNRIAAERGDEEVGHD